jgi:hypothetical protein
MTTQGESQKWQIKLVYILCGIVLLLVAYRSHILQITNDEAYSFILVDTIFTSKYAWKLMIGTANTHWLNSLALFIQTKILGNSMLALRLHSIIAFAFFAMSIVKISQLFQNFFTTFLTFFALVLLNSYAIDFFSQCRGYGLALAFQTYAIYFILKDHKSNTMKISILLSLSIWANFSFILFPICLLAVEFLSAIRSGLSGIINLIKKQIILLINILLAIPLLYYIKYITHDLEEGQSNGLLPDTFGVFLARSFHFLEATSLMYATVFIAAVILLTRIIFFYKEALLGLKILWLTFGLYLLFILFLFYVLASPFPYGRTALCVCIPALILLAEAIVCLLDKTSINMRRFGAPTLAVLAGIYFIQNKNINATNEWWMQQGLKECFAKFYTLEGKNISNVKLGMSIDHYGSFMNYYNYLQPEQCAQKVYNYYRNPYSTMTAETDSALKQQDYLMMIGDYKSYLDKIIPAEKRILIEHYPEMKTDLLKIVK